MRRALFRRFPYGIFFEVGTTEIVVYAVFHGDGICGLILFECAREERGTRDLIIRNFIARTDMMVRAVCRLWELQDYQDCWIIHRCLLDRLFYLSHLDQHDGFESF